jgi:predicted membrane-bound spermidine synthase
MSTKTTHAQPISSRPTTSIRSSQRRIQGWLLILLVLVAGAASLSVEFAASRLLAPYFGTSLFVWANLIGLILLYLTIGYYAGGRFADRYPRPVVLYSITALAALLIALIPVVSRPILTWSQLAFATYSIGVFYGSLVSVILLFALPMILLGCVSPFAIRLSVEQIVRSGRTAGQLYAISTVGSIFGTFFPVFVLIPDLGTYLTFFTTALALLLVSILGLFLSRSSDARDDDEQTSSGDTTVQRHEKEHGIRKTKRSGRRLFPLLLFLPLFATLLGIQGPIKPASYGSLLVERESAYNYIQVVRVGQETQLILNEGLAVHSIYDPNSILTGGPWDYFLIAPYFNKAPFLPQQVKRVAILGLGAGTIAHEFSNVYGPLPIDGVEIDGEIVKLGRQYFDMREPNLNVVVQDGRYYLRTTTQHYDLIGIDAYQQPYVPFQLTTSEFFGEVQAHLTPTGVAVVNAGHTINDYRLVEALAQTMHSVFSHVYIIDTQRFANSILVGTNGPSSIADLSENAAYLTQTPLWSVLNASIYNGNLREEQRKHVYFTDDKAPVEQLIDQIILGAVQQKGR